MIFEEEKFWLFFNYLKDHLEWSSHTITGTAIKIEIKLMQRYQTKRQRANNNNEKFKDEWLKSISIIQTVPKAVISIYLRNNNNKKKTLPDI